MPREPKTSTRCLFVYDTIGTAAAGAASEEGAERDFLPAAAAGATKGVAPLSRGRFDDGFDDSGIEIVLYDGWGRIENKVDIKVVRALFFNCYYPNNYVDAIARRV
jgi:hypothetical protein